MLKLRIAIISLLLCALFSVLALELGEAGSGTLLGHFVPFSLVLMTAVVFILALPARQHLNWIGIAMLTVSAYLILIISFQHMQSVPIPPLDSITIHAISLIVVVGLSCWVHSCITSFEISVNQLGINDSISNIHDPVSEESVQSMLMNSRYTGQSLGFIAIDVCLQTREKLQSQLVERLLKKAAKKHWQTEITSKLRKELRIIDKFYSVGTGSRLLLMCPGLNAKELAQLSEKLEDAISVETNSPSACSYVSFPSEALTLEGLIIRLDEKSGAVENKQASRSANRSAEKIPTRKVAERTLVEEQGE